MVSRGLIKLAMPPIASFSIWLLCYVFIVSDRLMTWLITLMTWLIVPRWFYKYAGIFYLIGSLYGLTDDLQLVIKILAFYIA